MAHIGRIFAKVIKKTSHSLFRVIRVNIFPDLGIAMIYEINILAQLKKMVYA